MSESLWPNFDLEETPVSPKAIIDTSGAGLDEKTGGLVRFYRMSVGVNGNTVEAQYSLYSPTLQYHFPFMRASFPVKPGYPVKLVADQVDDLVAADEPELVRSLKSIFTAPSTIDTVQRLMSLAK